MKTDKDTTVAELIEFFCRFRDERNWKRFHNPKDLAVSSVIEATELLQIFQWKSREEVEEMLKNPVKFKRIKDELADLFSYVLALADVLGVDITTILKEKKNEDAKKYPAEKVSQEKTFKKYTEYE